MTQTQLIGLMSGDVPDVKATPEQMVRLAEIAGKGIEAQGAEFLKGTGHCSRTCRECKATYVCGFVFSPYPANLGQWIWQQSHCDACLEEYLIDPSKRKPRKRSRFIEYSDYNYAALPDIAKKLSEIFLKWTPHQPTGCGLVGAPGSGKSYLLYQLGRILEARGDNLAVLDDHDVNEMIKPEQSKARAAFISDLNAATVLIWDDFGTAKMTDAVEEFYNRVLEIAYQKKIHILATTNYTGKQLMEQWARQTKEFSWEGPRGDKILRRLKDRCQFFQMK